MEQNKAGTSIGVTLGTSALLFFWVAGDLILGLPTFMTQGSKILIEEEIDVNGEIKKYPGDKSTGLVPGPIALGVFIILISVMGRSVEHTDTAANVSNVSSSQDAVAINAASTNSESIDKPSPSTNLRQRVIARCRDQMAQYGASLVKACVDQDVGAEAALQHY